METFTTLIGVTSNTQKDSLQLNMQKCLSQHAILQITLDGPSIALTILGIIAAIHLFHPSVTCIIVALLPLPWIVHNDFQNFLLLGPGGTPSTFAGYLRITYLRLFALSNPYAPCTITQEIHPPTGLHKRSSSWLPLRQGRRPNVAGIAPHRQIDQPGCKDMDKILRSILHNLAEVHPDTLFVGQSCFEKKGLALFARNPINTTCKGEICHVHHSDGSLHMNIHPDDAKEVLNKKWGERHPLAKGGWLTQFVPKEFTMIYAPRNLTELQVLCRIIEAATYWVSGTEMEIKVPGETVTQAKDSIKIA